MGSSHEPQNLVGPQRDGHNSHGAYDTSNTLSNLVCHSRSDSGPGHLNTIEAQPKQVWHAPTSPLYGRGDGHFGAPAPTRRRSQSIVPQSSHHTSIPVPQRIPFAHQRSRYIHSTGSDAWITHHYGDSAHPYNIEAGASRLSSQWNYATATNETYNSPGSGFTSSPHHGQLDSNFRVRERGYFIEGRIMEIRTYDTVLGSGHSPPTNISSVGSIGKQGGGIHDEIRRVVVVQHKQDFCYVCPIDTYNGQATTRKGVRPEEHAIVFTSGHVPLLVAGEKKFELPSLPVIISKGGSPLDVASRIFFGLHHPIHYGAKVKDIGYIPQEYIQVLIGSWRHIDCEATGLFQKQQDDKAGKDINDIEDEGRGDSIYQDLAERNEDKETMRRNEGLQHTACAMEPELHAASTNLRPQNTRLELVTNPRAFFKKGRVFMTLWSEPKGTSGDAFFELTRFAVIKTSPTFSICLRISTYSGQATTKLGLVAHHHAAIVPVDGRIVPHPKGESVTKKIDVKIENPDVTIDPMSRINFAKPYSVEHNIKVRNVGRVVGEYVGLLDHYFATSMGYVKSS